MLGTEGRGVLFAAEPLLLSSALLSGLLPLLMWLLLAAPTLSLRLPGSVSDNDTASPVFLPRYHPLPTPPPPLTHSLSPSLQSSQSSLHLFTRAAQNLARPWRSRALPLRRTSFAGKRPSDRRHVLCKRYSDDSLCSSVSIGFIFNSPRGAPPPPPPLCLT